jgi:hypothetical protein
VTLADGTPFSNTISGTITPILLVALIAVAGYVWKTVSASLAEQSRALTVISTQFVPIQRDVAAAQTDVASLKTETALLRQALDKHEAWHERHDTTGSI